ncbi:Ger(x)C family spore germination protein [Paenibacillus arenilitoris]|uniref:Ger(X)C family spore germination protein n=1 Tax=Paenibacillus arenilitoris TaxID=2772299 RepID=A0A927H5X3_9BACL|nr:Ger(x)C family spore germination protein [Paenibacillus arenilitoris]MBD2867994.1 Ger(x)C family spore germination protein [Paenibacillus arenilitoris]
MKWGITIGMLLVLLINTGCWDREEINDIGLVMGTGLDLADNGQIKATIQIAVPAPSSQTSGGASKETEKFFLISAVGKNGIDLDQKLQQKMSRTLFFSHRSVILIGEDMARKGLNDILDTFSRNPRNRLKTYVLVVKGMKAEDLLRVEYPYELAPSEGLKEMELLLGEGTVVTLRDFFIASASEGLYPTTGVLEPALIRKSGKKGNEKLFRINGTAIFKSSKLVGFLNNTETHQYLWFKKNKRTDKIVADLPGGKGNVGFILTSGKFKIKTVAASDPLKFHVGLKANGNMFENNSSLDVTDSNNLEIIKKALENRIKQDMDAFLRKIQTQYKTDIVGFGQQLQRDNPKKWRTVAKQWDRHFADAEISVTVNLSIQNTGAIGPSLQLKDKEIVK